MIDLGIADLRGPVFVIPPAGLTQQRPALAWKVLFRDGAQMVIASGLRVLWAGADGVAWSLPPSAPWKNLGTMTNGVIRL